MSCRSIDIKALENLLDSMMAERLAQHADFNSKKDYDNAFIQYGIYLGLFTAKNNLWQVTKYDSDKLTPEEKDHYAKLSIPDNYGTSIFT